MAEHLAGFFKKCSLISISLCFLCLNCCPLSLQIQRGGLTSLFAEENDTPRTSPIIKEAFSAFTGVVVSEKLDIRIRPEENSPVICQMDQNELLLVYDEQKDFWVVSPPPKAKAYIFRSFVLDGVVEGTRVNMRLQPDIDSPVVGHLNTGERVQGEVSKKSKKWLEISYPPRLRLFVHKKGIRNVGPADVKERHERRLAEVQSLFSLAEKKLAIATTLSFDKIDFESMKKDFTQIIQEYAEHDVFVEKAKNALARVQDLYLKTKLAFLETHSITSDMLNKKEEGDDTSSSSNALENSPITLSFWKKLEEAFYANWIQANCEKSVEDFYTIDLKEAYTVTGIVAPFAAENFHKPPGNFILYKRDIPQAYLYSTTVDLDQYVGKEVSITVTKRPNNHFAFPAFFVHAVEESAK